MTGNPPNGPEDPPVDPFPTGTGASPFPPLEGEAPADPPQDPPSDWIETADAHDLPTQDKLHPLVPERLVALGRFAFPPAPAPDEEGVAARARRWTSHVIMLVTVFLLVFNAASIQNWSRQQAPGWVTSTVQQLADVWVAQITQLGADQPRQAVRDAYEGLHRLRFPGQKPAPKEEG
jgi:hypothetical protein